MQYQLSILILFSSSLYTSTELTNSWKLVMIFGFGAPPQVFFKCPIWSKTLRVPLNRRKEFTCGIPMVFKWLDDATSCWLWYSVDSVTFVKSQIFRGRNVLGQDWVKTWDTTIMCILTNIIWISMRKTDVFSELEMESDGNRPQKGYQSSLPALWGTFVYSWVICWSCSSWGKLPCFVW